MGSEDEIETMLSQMNTSRQNQAKAEPLLPQSTRDETEILGTPAPAPAPVPVAEPVAAPVPSPVVAEEPPPAEETAPPSPSADPVPPPPVSHEEPLIKTRETIHRPPLPQPGLYDSYSPKPPPLARKLLVTDEPAAPATPQEDRRMVKPEALPVSNAEALAALEAWSTLVPKHPTVKRPRNHD